MEREFFSCSGILSNRLVAVEINKVIKGVEYKLGFNSKGKVIMKKGTNPQPNKGNPSKTPPVKKSTSQPKEKKSDVRFVSAPSVSQNQVDTLGISSNISDKSDITEAEIREHFKNPNKSGLDFSSQKVIEAMKNVVENIDTSNIGSDNGVSTISKASLSAINPPLAHNPPLEEEDESPQSPDPTLGEETATHRPLLSKKELGENKEPNPLCKSEFPTMVHNPPDQKQSEVITRSTLNKCNQQPVKIIHKSVDGPKKMLEILLETYPLDKFLLKFQKRERKLTDQCKSELLRKFQV